MIENEFLNYVGVASEIQPPKVKSELFGFGGVVEDEVAAEEAAGDGVFGVLIGVEEVTLVGRTNAQAPVVVDAVSRRREEAAVAQGEAVATGEVDGEPRGEIGEIGGVDSLLGAGIEQGLQGVQGTGIRTDLTEQRVVTVGVIQREGVTFAECPHDAEARADRRGDTAAAAAPNLTNGQGIRDLRPLVGPDRRGKQADIDTFIVDGSIHLPGRWRALDQMTRLRREIGRIADAAMAERARICLQVSIDRRAAGRVARGSGIMAAAGGDI